MKNADDSKLKQAEKDMQHLKEKSKETLKEISR